MDVHIYIEKKHLIVSLVVIMFFGLFSIGSAVKLDETWVPLQQIARDSTNTDSVDSTGSGIIDYAENLDSSTGASEVNNILNLNGNNILDVGAIESIGESINIASDVNIMNQNNINSVGLIDLEKAAVNKGGIIIDTGDDTKPNCDSSNRGLLWNKMEDWDEDELLVCLRDGDGNYLWAEVYQIRGANIYNFTSCGKVGETGPSQNHADFEYAGTRLEGEVNIIGSGIQQWTVPHDGTYRVTAYGSEGGDGGADSDRTGAGAKISGEFDLQGGEVLEILVGQTGGGIDTGAGGGGGTFVVREGITINDEDSILVIAGGGGGYGRDGDGRDASVGSSGTWDSSGNNEGGVDGGAGEDDSDIDGGTAGHPGGGAGIWENGSVWWRSGSELGSDALAYVNSGEGGLGPGRQEGEGGFGGFGGAGGGAEYNWGPAGGGGGGYSGGAGGWRENGLMGAGGGGGSYNNGANQNNEAGVVDDGDGWVEIEFIGQ